MSSKIIHLPEIGDIILAKSRQNKRLVLTIKPSGQVRVSLPARGCFKEAEKFVLNKKEWIQQSIEKVKSKSSPMEIIDENTNFMTGQHVLKFYPHKLKRARCELDKGCINIYYPENSNIRDDYVQKCVRKGINIALWLEAEEYLPKRAELLSQKTGLKYKKLQLFNSKRCWGMCMSDNSIKLNIHLMRLSADLTDYVILHELAHIKEKNHGKKFYDLLGGLIPEPKAWSKIMRKLSPSQLLMEASSFKLN